MVGNLAFFDTDDTVSGVPGSSLLGFAIVGDIVLNLTGYAGITGFSTVSPQAIGGAVNMTVGQDFYTSNSSGGSMSFLALGNTVVLDASALDASGVVLLQSFGSGNDVLTGGAGNDNLVGAGGADQLNGGAGIDAVRYDLSSAGVTVNLATGIGAGGDAQGDTFSNVEAATGSGFADTLTGGAGSDFLVGLGGNDLLTGGAGADWLQGEDGIDWASYRGSSAGVVVDLTSGTATGGDAGGDTLTSIENLMGSSFVDVLTGNAGDNVLNDGGVGGADTLTGGGGNDTYSVYNAGAVIVEIGGEGNDRVSAGVSYVLADGVSVEYLNTTSLNASYAVDLTGNGLAQLVRGNAGANVLDGAGGNDVLFGMGGADVFSFSTALGAGNVDRIGDFSVTDDQIQLDSAIFTALGAGPLDGSAFKDNFLAPRDADDRIFYNSNTGSLFYDADGSGSGFAAVKFAVLATGLSLSAADFSVI
ncbi:calcium-binding protein [Mesorhizobium sp. IMUNJ 23232]|uniref:calcium-binding protein n=1 Tax=Mesorhizobium sp. IMUNJ 23232 TaxID=3376064 RepID=UPI0037A6297E